MSIPLGGSIFPLTLITQPIPAEFLPDTVNQLLNLIAQQCVAQTGGSVTNPAVLTVQDNVFTIQNATDATKQIIFSAANQSAGATATFRSLASANRTITFPDATDTVVLTSSTQTLANKTITDFINTGTKLCTAQLDKTTSTVLATVTGLSVALTAGASYKFRAHLTGTSTANGGAKAAMVGTGGLTATSFTATGWDYNGSTLNTVVTTTTLGNNVVASTTVFTDIIIEGAIVVNVAGTLNVQFAQNASHADTSSVFINSDLAVSRVA